MYRKINCLMIFFLCGCANLGTVSRVSKLSDETTAIHLDSAQRLVYEGKEHILCAEPTPDALQSYANAFGGSLTAPGKDNTSLSNAFAVNAMGVGLHTQSITLMRDILYRICEASYSKRLSDVSVQQLLQHAQDLTLGVLAIEQLTGVVAARQPVIINTASASAAGAINDYQAQLELAKGSEASKKSVLENAVRDEDAAKRDLAAKKLLHDEETKKPASDETEKKLVQLNNEISTLDTALSAKVTARQAADTDYKRAVDATKAIESMAKAALSTSSGTTGGTQVMADVPSRAKVENESTKDIAEATVKIVQSIVYKRYIPDGCMAIFSKLAIEDSAKIGGGTVSKVDELCIELIKSDLEKKDASIDFNSSSFSGNVAHDQRMEQREPAKDIISVK